MDGRRGTELPDKTLPLWVGIRNALGMAALCWLLLGVGNFWLLTQYLAGHFQHDLLFASFLLDLGFLAGILILIGVILLWQRAHGETLRDLGWGRPTRVIAIVIAVLFGLLWAASAYVNQGTGTFSDPFRLSWERPLMAVIGLVLAFGEELVWRGFFMEQLRRAGIPLGIAIPAAGILMGSYHGQIGSHFDVQYWISASVIFTLVGVIFWIGKRSLTPGYIAHAMSHLLGDPVLTQGILIGASYLSGLR